MPIDIYIRELPSIDDTLSTYKLSANKNLGQNFLRDFTVTDKIVSALGDISKRTILEIGPGVGTLTRSILAYEPKKLHVVEFDTRFLPVLESIQKIAGERMHIHIGDALKFDETSIGDNLLIIANLPYNIGTNLVMKWLEKLDIITEIVVMLQKEVIQRFVALPSDSEYGKLSVLISLLCNTDVIMEVAPYHFIPAPKVESQVIRITPKQDRISFEEIKRVASVCSAAFMQRRKKVRTSLKSFLSDEDFTKLEIDSNKRAQDLTPSEYLQIARFLASKAK